MLVAAVRCLLVLFMTLSKLYSMAVRWSIAEKRYKKRGGRCFYFGVFFDILSPMSIPSTVKGGPACRNQKEIGVTSAPA